MSQCDRPREQTWTGVSSEQQRQQHQQHQFSTKASVSVSAPAPMLLTEFKPSTGPWAKDKHSPQFSRFFFFFSVLVKLILFFFLSGHAIVIKRPTFAVGIRPNIEIIVGGSRRGGGGIPIKLALALDLALFFFSLAPHQKQQEQHNQCCGAALLTETAQWLVSPWQQLQQQQQQLQQPGGGAITPVLYLLLHARRYRSATSPVILAWRLSCRHNEPRKKTRKHKAFFVLTLRALPSSLLWPARELCASQCCLLCGSIVPPGLGHGGAIGAKTKLPTPVPDQSL